MNILKDLSAKYYQRNKESLQKRACERYQGPSEEDAVLNDTQVFPSILEVF